MVAAEDGVLSAVSEEAQYRQELTGGELLEVSSNLLAAGQAYHWRSRIEEGEYLCECEPN